MLISSASNTGAKPETVADLLLVDHQVAPALHQLVHLPIIEGHQALIQHPQAGLFRPDGKAEAETLRQFGDGQLAQLVVSMGYWSWYNSASMAWASHAAPPPIPAAGCR